MVAFYPLGIGGTHGLADLTNSSTLMETTIVAAWQLNPQR
jgi:hypothetical protein